MAIEAVANPELLVWSRETAGLSVDDAAHLIDVKPEKLAAWEAGAARPTIGQLRRLAEKYKRPLNVFFLPKRPSEPSLDHLHDFRTLPDGLPVEMSRPLRFALRNLRAWRLDALDLYRELELAPPILTINHIWRRH